MILEHAAVWTKDLERLKEFYGRYFGAVAGDKYVNPVTCFESYFLEFESGARLEIMFKPGIGDGVAGQNDRVGMAHLAFGVASMALVDKKAREFTAAGIEIIRGPRKTGDGYYEFEMADPDGNRLEVAAPWVAERDA